MAKKKKIEKVEEVKAEVVQEEVKQDTVSEIKKEGKHLFKRFIAYILDLLLVSMVAAELGTLPINPNYKDYNEKTNAYSEFATSYSSITYLSTYFNEENANGITEDEYNQILSLDTNGTFSYLLVEAYQDGTLTKDELTSIQEKSAEIYNEKAETIYLDYLVSSKEATIIQIVCVLLYFVLFPVCTKGYTLFKKALGYRIVSKNGEDAKWYQYLLRCVLLYGVIFDIVEVILLYTLSGNALTSALNYCSEVSMIVSIILLISVVYSKTGRGLHELLAGTKLISKES